MASSTSKEVQHAEPAEEPPLRKSILSGSLTGWTLDVPAHLHKASVLDLYGSLGSRLTPCHALRSLVCVPLYVGLAPLAYRLTRPNGYFSAFLDNVYGPRKTSSSLSHLLREC